MHKVSTFGNALRTTSIARRRGRLVGTAILALIALIGAAVPAAAGSLVDPNTLQPVPPNATCRDDGRQVICDTFIEESALNEPIVDFDGSRGDGRPGKSLLHQLPPGFAHCLRLRLVRQDGIESTGDCF